MFGCMLNLCLSDVRRAVGDLVEVVMLLYALDVLLVCLWPVEFWVVAKLWLSHLCMKEGWSLGVTAEGHGGTS